MKIQTKKIIAREFLILLLCIVIAILTFLAIYPYNYFKQNQIGSLTKEIATKRLLSDSLSKSYKQKTEKQYWYSDAYKSKFDIPRYADYINATLWDGLYKIAKGDSLKIKWYSTLNKELVSLNKELGFDTPENFQTFILTNIIDAKDIETNQIASKTNLEADKLQTKIQEISRKIVSTQNQFRTAGLAFIIAAIALFILRYIFYGIKWSVRTLKQS